MQVISILLMIRIFRFQNACWLTVFLVCLISTGAGGQTGGSAAKHRILVDGSGSMRGFFSNGKIRDLHGVIAEQGSKNAESYYFINEGLKQFDQVEDVPRGRNDTAGGFGGRTVLATALASTLAEPSVPAMVWLITDNQSSAGSDTESDQDLERFYEGLRTNRVKRIYFFPLRLPYTGPLYKSDGVSVLKNDYSGPRGLLVYALLLDETARDEFERAVKSFQERLGRIVGVNEFRSFLIKPLEQDTVTAKLLPGEKFIVDGNRVIGGDFEEGKPIHGEFKLELTSQLGQVDISGANIEVKSGKFNTQDFVESEPNFVIRPNTITSFKPGPENKKEFAITMDFPGVHTRRGLASWWHSMSAKRGRLEGQVQIAITVPPQNLHVVPETATQFSTTKDIYLNSDPEVQKRIYRLDDLVRKMMPSQTLNIQPRVGENSDGRIPVNVNVRLSPGLIYLWLLPLFLLLLLLLLFWWKRRPIYRLTWENDRYRACPDFHLGLFSRRRIVIDSKIAAAIKKSLSGVRVSANRDYSIDNARSRPLSEAGTSFNVSRVDDSTGVSFRFSKANNLKTKSKSTEIFSETSYGSDSNRAVDDTLVATQPIRKPTTDKNYKGSSTTSSSNDDDNDDFDFDSLLK